MLHYSFNADLREVLRRLATAAEKGNSQSKGSNEKRTVHALGHRAATQPQQ